MQLATFLKRFFGSGDDTPYQVYGAVVAQARRHAFYAELGVPDTLEGRYDMIVLHAFLLFDRLRGAGAERRLSQEVIDLMFADFDRSLREMGVGDLSIPKKMKTMASAFNGRLRAYQEAFDAGSEEAMRDAIARNLFPDEGGAPAAARWLARYAFAARDALARQSLAAIAERGPEYPPVGRGEQTA